MGITNLKKLLKGEFKTSPIKESLVKTINISEFAGEKVGVDISSYIYKYKITQGDNWLNSALMFICMLKKANVHGTFLFDGKAPVEKDAEAKRRRDVSTNLEDKIVNLSFDLDTYKDTNVISDLLKETMKKIGDKDAKIGKVGKLLHAGKKSKSEAYIDVEAIDAFIKKKEDQNNKPTREDSDTLKKMLTHFGATYIQAPGEAESLAAYLFSIGDVKAVITEDTDILAYGVETYISGLNANTGDCEVIYLSEVLDATELNLEEFREFCIMCGCDYGNNIKGVGTATALKLIQKHKSIEAYVTATGVDPTILNHIASREIFETYGRLIKSKVQIVEVDDDGKEIEDTKKEDTKKEDTKKEDTKKEDTKKEDTKKEDTKKEDTKKEDTKKEDTKKEDTKKEDTKKEDTKKEDTKKED
ncbi:MAG: hypothetical protein PHG66_06485, partial [Candidatus Colwellbacteria bacterium]|nr:hypothetical protein [Candidatus Colwellbacteria bacterium]